MSKEWETARIEAYKRYIEHDRQKIAQWEASLEEHEKGVERAKSAIKSHQESLERTIKELAEQWIEI